MRSTILAVFLGIVVVSAQQDPCPQLLQTFDGCVGTKLNGQCSRSCANAQPPAPPQPGSPPPASPCCDCMMGPRPQGMDALHQRVRQVMDPLRQACQNQCPDLNGPPGPPPLMGNNAGVQQGQATQNFNNRFNLNNRNTNAALPAWMRGQQTTGTNNRYPRQAYPNYPTATTNNGRFQNLNQNQNVPAWMRNLGNQFQTGQPTNGNTGAVPPRYPFPGDDSMEDDDIDGSMEGMDDGPMGMLDDILEQGANTPCGQCLARQNPQYQTQIRSLATEAERMFQQKKQQMRQTMQQMCPTISSQVDQLMDCKKSMMRDQMRNMFQNNGQQLANTFRQGFQQMGTNRQQGYQQLRQGIRQGFQQLQQGLSSQYPNMGRVMQLCPKPPKGPPGRGPPPPFQQGNNNNNNNQYPPLVPLSNNNNNQYPYNTNNAIPNNNNNNNNRYPYNNNNNNRYPYNNNNNNNNVLPRANNNNPNVYPRTNQFQNLYPQSGK